MEELYKIHDIETYNKNPDADKNLVIDLRSLPSNHRKWKRGPKTRIWAIVHKKLAEIWFKE